MINVTAGRMRVEAPMVMTGAAELKTLGEQAIVSGATVIDLSRVTEADSSGVALLLAWVRLAKERNQALSIEHVPESIRSLAALYGVVELLPFA